MKITLVKQLNTEDDMLAFAARVSTVISNGMVIFLKGQLGAGKTTFTRGFLSGLGYQHKVKSPTYTIVEPYEVNGRIIYHFDFYRIEHPQELELIGIQDYFQPHAICLIEWPEKGDSHLPEPDLICNIAFAKNGREMQIVAKSEQGRLALHKLT